MPNQEKKLQVLVKIARLFKEQDITWAVGASLLLYFNGVVDDFHDLDLLIHMKDAFKAKEILSSLGEIEIPESNPMFTTKHFCKFKIENVDIDMMAGFGVIYEGQEYDLALHADQIEEYKEIDNINIPLQSLELWKDYYRYIGRPQKVKMIENYYKKK